MTMAQPTVSFSVLVIAAAAAALLLLSTLVDADGSCSHEDSIRKLKKACKRCLEFVDKSKDDERMEAEDIPEECCSALKGADVACICSFVPDFVYDFMSMRRFVFAVQICSDKKLEGGSKCGNYTVPPTGLGSN